MSHPRDLLGDSRPLAVPAKIPLKSKRLRTKRERNAAKFGPKLPVRGSRRGPAAPLRWLQPPMRGGLALGSPLRPPKPVVITQNRLCHRGLFNHEVRSLDVRRLLTPSRDIPPPAPQIEEGEAGDVSGAALKELVAGLASKLVGFGAFVGRDLVSERRRSLVAALRRHRRGPADLGVFLAHRTPAQPPGQGTPREEARPGRPGPALILGRWDAGDAPAGTPNPPGVVNTLPRAPSPIFGALGARENPFSWSSAEDEDETPGGLPQAWGGPGGLPPPPPPFWGFPQPPHGEEEEEERGDAGWTPIPPLSFSPDPPPGRAPRTPRPPRAPKIWRTETPWDSPGPSRAPWDPPRPPWDPPRTPPRPSRAPQLWSREPRKAPPVPLRPPWDSPRPPWDPSPWSPELPRHPRTPQLWDPEPPRAPLDPPRPHRDPPGVPRPLWGSPDPTWLPLDPPGSPRAPQLWSPEPPWDPRPWSPEPPGAPQDAELSRCCCRRLCRDTAQRRPLRRDPLCHCAARRDPFCRDTLCRDTSRGAPPRPAALCRDPRCRDMPRCCRQPPKRRGCGCLCCGGCDGATTPQ
nr:basic proline-rich protein-like isoform X2 [Taeniopygia guttata]